MTSIFQNPIIHPVHWENYNGLMLYIPRLRGLWWIYKTKKIFTKYSLESQHSPSVSWYFFLICRFTLSKSLSTVFVLPDLSFFLHFVQTLSLHVPRTRKLISASNEEQLAFLLYLTKCRVTTKNIMIFGHNNTTRS